MVWLKLVPPAPARRRQPPLPADARARSRTANGREVDFACRRGRALDELVQVTLSLADPQVRAREVDALTEALDEQDLAIGLVLTESEREDLSLGKRYTA